MDALEYIVNKWNLDITHKSPIEIPNVGRNDLAKLFCELGFTSGVEVGVECGVYTEVLCLENPQAKIYAVNSWKSYRDYRDYINQEKIDGFYEAAKERLKNYNCELIRWFSADAAMKFDDGSLDFVYIDGNHDFRYVVNDLYDWSKKVRRGGIISGHDYRSTVNDFPLHVVEAVGGFTHAYRISPWFLLGTKAVVSGQVRERSRSFMWVKQ